MYDNNKLKQRFVKSLNTSKVNEDAYLKKFENVSEYEESLEKDLCNFTVNEIMQYYRGLFLTSLESLMMINSAFRKYTDYCLGLNAVDSQINHYTEIDNEVLMACISQLRAAQKVVTREQLYDDITYFINPVEAFICVALYHGICGVGYSELSEIRPSDIDRENKTVKLCTGRIIKVDNTFIKLAIQSADEYDHYYIDADGETTLSKVGYLKEDNRCIKNHANSLPGETPERRRRCILNILGRIRERNNSEAYNYKALMESGRIEMIQSYGEDDVRETIINHRDEIEYIYGTISSVSRWMLKYEKYIHK